MLSIRSTNTSLPLKKLFQNPGGRGEGIGGEIGDRDIRGCGGKKGKGEGRGKGKRGGRLSLRQPPGRDGPRLVRWASGARAHRESWGELERRSDGRGPRGGFRSAPRGPAPPSAARAQGTSPVRRIANAGPGRAPVRCARRPPAVRQPRGSASHSAALGRPSASEFRSVTHRPPQGTHCPLERTLQAKAEAKACGLMRASGGPNFASWPAPRQGRGL